MLVLVRRRGNAFDAVIQALKHAGIPVAGADRLKLTEHIAIIDLMNLADALLLPQDDLALAVALKSPLFGLGDDELFKLAWQRKGSLRGALDQHAGSNDTDSRPRFDRLKQCERRFAARRRLRSMPGCSAATAAGRGSCDGSGTKPTTRSTSFSSWRWLRAKGAGLAARIHGVAARRRHRSQARHGNLARRGPRHDGAWRQGAGSAGRVPGRYHNVARRYHASETDSHAARQRRAACARRVVWAGKKAEDPPAVAAARAAMLDETEDEYRRLLYVAMTRAADRLIVAGCMPGNRNELRELSWYDLIVKGLEGSGSAYAERAAAGRRGEALFAA